jgi:hypothetical protein
VNRILLLVGVVFLSGCTSPSNWFHKLSAVVKTPTSEVRQVGDAAQPVQVTTSTTKTEAPIPAGSKITIETPAQKPDEPSKPTPTLVSSTTVEHVVGPTSFQPPSPPTPSQLADGQVKVWFWLGVLVGGCAAIFGLVRDWNLVMYGGLAVAGACLFAIFVQQSPWVLIVIGLGVGLKFAGPYIWHTQVKQTITTSTDTTVPPKS